MKAWEYIERHGWCQHKTHEDSGECCTAYAIAEVYRKNGFSSKYELLGQVIKHNVMLWNDRPGQTKENVVSTLKELDI